MLRYRRGTGCETREARHAGRGREFKDLQVINGRPLQLLPRSKPNCNA